MRTLSFFLLLLSILFFSTCKKTNEPVNTNPDVLSITSFSPDSVHIGDTVTIIGKGFSTTVNQNEVIINSKLQKVVSAAENQLKIEIQPETVSGPISVKVGSVIATASAILTILSPTPGLQIISFSPDSVHVGDTVIIRGNGFSPVPANNILKVNDTTMQVISSIDTIITAKVLPGSTTGKITVEVNSVVATSATDLKIIQDTWSEKSALSPVWPDNTAGSQHAFVNGFSANGKGYYFKSSELWEYTPGTDSWIRKSDMPASSRKYCFAFGIGSKAYIGLGASNPGTAPVKEVWEYDATMDTWTQKNDFPGKARVVPFSFVIGNTGYMGGGDTSNAGVGDVSDFWKYDPVNDSWTQLADYPGAEKKGISGFSINGYGYTVETGAGNPTAPPGAATSIALWRYDTSSNTWEQKTGVPTEGRTVFNRGTAFSINGKGYAFYGPPANTVGSKDDFWEYDPVTDSWTKRSDVGGGIRWFGSGFSIGDKGYIGVGVYVTSGGTYNGPRTDFWEYTPL